MIVKGEPKVFIRSEAKEYIDLYASLGERAEIFVPKSILDNLRSFTRLCYDEPIDPAKQQSEINRYILSFKEDIPGYVDVSLMLYPHEDSKAFQYTARRTTFKKRLTSFIDTESIDDTTKGYAKNLLGSHDFSVGTPPVTKEHIEFMSQIVLGDSVRNLRKFRDVIGVTEHVDEGHWNYLMDILDQMIIQSSHYTTKPEKDDFLHRTGWTVNFKGLNGLIRTVVSGNADTAVNLLQGEVFNSRSVVVKSTTSADELFNLMQEDSTRIFIVKVDHMRKNMFLGREKWFPLLTRLVIVDDSQESRQTNTSLVFSMHNGIINKLNKVHTKKLGSPANTQLNIRLILENVSSKSLSTFHKFLENKINEFEAELVQFKMEQFGETDNPQYNLALYKFDDFTKQILKDKYALEKLRDFLYFLENLKTEETREKQNHELIQEFEEQTKQYFYSNIREVRIATILEGGGRNQIRTYGEYLLKEKKLKDIDEKIIRNCRIILDIIPHNYKRTLHTHYHKNFGINLFLEKYQEYLSKIDNSGDNKGRFLNFMIDLGIYEDFKNKPEAEQKIIKEFLSDLGNLDSTSIADDVQMIIRDLLFHKEGKPKPYILFNQDLSWEYRDLFPDDRFDNNPFDLDMTNFEDGRINYDRLLTDLIRIKNTMQLFDPSGNLWDRFCENLTILINDPSNPTGYSDFNSETLLRLLKFINNSKITLFLDEAYSDSVKIDNEDEPKWRTISRYVLNNISKYPNIHVVSSLSTTKNLGAPGDRLGSLIATPSCVGVIDFARKLNIEIKGKGNSNSLYILNSTMEIAQTAKKLKDKLESNLPKEASRYKIKDWIENFIKDETEKKKQQSLNNNRQLKKLAGFEGSPVHIFLLEELVALDKLDMLGLPDDFKYRGETFFAYYLEYIVKQLNKFRVNKNFRNESNKRLKLAKEIAKQIIEEGNHHNLKVIDSDGSYLFNIRLTEFSSYNDLLLFTQRFAEERGIAALPYKSGVIRFSLGGYLEGDADSYHTFKKEFETTIKVFITYFQKFHQERATAANDVSSEYILDKIFKTKSEKEFLDVVLKDFKDICSLKRKTMPGLKLKDIRMLYHASPEKSGVSITSIGDSKNSVLEFHGSIGKCENIEEFITSRAFTKVYEDILSQIYKNIPQLKNLDFNTVATKYSKATLFKYIHNKKTFHPNHFVLDDPEEENLMREILIEMENLLFSDSKMKILALKPTEDPFGDKARLEGINKILRKYIEEILLHFNLPFAKKPVEPSRKEIIRTTKEKFELITGINVEEFNLHNYVFEFINGLREDQRFRELTIGSRMLGIIMDVLEKRVLEEKIDTIDKLLYLYLFVHDNSFVNQIIDKLQYFESKINETKSSDEKIHAEKFITEIAPVEFNDIINYIVRKQDIKVSEDTLHRVTRKAALFFITIINKTRGVNFYEKYTHSLIKVVETEFKGQNSGINEMIQHGISLHREFEMENKILETYNNGELKWINKLMTKCGVIGSEQAIQTHTRIVTDAKKREYPFLKVDRLSSKRVGIDKGLAAKDPRYFIKNMEIKPTSQFFINRLARFIDNLDAEDYRCKIMKHGLINELAIVQKGYMKYLTDYFRLTKYEDISLNDVKQFVPDVIMFFGAPEKVISFPQVGYFDIPGPNGSIKTIVTPLKKEVDYFGDIKKPRLQMINEKIKEMGGIPKHGSLFIVEEEDGCIFGIEVDGDSGGGKSEMIAAMILKWLKQNLPSIRSIRLVAGDMFHQFRDKEGNLYGIGTEVGDFSRTTDFDPDFISYYRYLFESSADSNVTDLNSRSTVSGLCDTSMLYKIDIMLTASNYSKNEAGITRVDNPENFLLYVDSHGERKEKATSEDGPNLQRTLLRYISDPNIATVIAKHGNYLDTIFDWEQDKHDGKFYLSSSYKMIDKIDIVDVVNKLFVTKIFTHNKIKYIIHEINFDIIKNRFVARVSPKEAKEEYSEMTLSRNIFGSIFDTLASTPAGQPFVAEEGQNELRTHLVNAMKTGKGKNIQCGILSTEIGKKGKEITGPQKAAEDMKKMIQEVRIQNPEINEYKNTIKSLINTKYKHIFKDGLNSNKIWRYNLYLYQLDLMKKAEFCRMDNVSATVDLSRLKMMNEVDKNKEFCPLLITPNINIELNGFSETYKDLMSLPNYTEFADEFSKDVEELYVAEGYHEDTILNNMVIQLLLKDGYINIDDLSQGRISEKVNRETIAAAKYAIEKFMEQHKKIEPKIQVKSQEQKNRKSNKEAPKDLPEEHNDQVQ